MDTHTTEFESEAREKVKMAEKAMKKKPFPLSLFSSYDPQYAADLYFEAADIYFAVKNLNLSAECYIASAEILKKIKTPGSNSQIAQCYMKAGDVYNMKEYYNPQGAVECYSNSATYYAKSGNFSLSASRSITAAEICLSFHEYEGAELHFSKALDSYKMANMSASSCLVQEKLVLCLLKNKKYSNAGDIFLELGGFNRDNKEQNMLFAYMCYYMCNDKESTENIYIAFPSSDEKDIIDSFYEENESKELFEKRIDKYLQLNSVKDEVKILINDVKKQTHPEFSIL